MKVLQVTGGLNIGGLENVAANIARYKKDNMQIDYLIYEPTINGYQEELENLGCNIFQIVAPSENFQQFAKSYLQLMKREKYDVVHIHTFTSAGFLSLLSKLSGVKKIVVHSHTQGERLHHIGKKGYHFLMKSLIHVFADHKLAVGKSAGEALYFKEFQVLLNGINIKAYQYNEMSAQIMRERLKISSSTRVIGHVGRLSAEKNQEHIIKLLNYLVNYNADYHLILVGSGNEYQNKLENLVSQLKLDKYVTFVGAVSNAIEMLNAMDLMVFPSLYEGVPLSLIEAQANGLSIIASDTIDPKVKVSDHVYFLSLSDPIETWADYVKNVPARNFNASLEKYDIQQIMDSLYKLYNC